MSNKTANIVVFLALWVLIFLNAFQFLINPKFVNKNITQDKIDEITNVNGKIFDTISKINVIIENNSGTLMRFSHFQDGHTEEYKGRMILCPECAVPTKLPDSAFFESEPELTDIPETLDQILEDVHEIHQSVEAIAFSSINQDVGLRIVLEKFRNPDSDRKDLHKKIYKPLSEYGFEGGFNVKQY